MTPIEAARAIEDELYAVSGKPVLIHKDPTVSGYASIRIASDDSPAHLLRYKPEFESDLPYLSAFQCGLALRVAQADPACRFDLTSTATMKQDVQQLVEETLKKNGTDYPMQTVLQLSNQLGNGLGLQLRSIPIAIRVDDWINRQYPVLRALQRKSNERQLQEAMQSLGPSIRAFAPQPIIEANVSMSCAFGDFEGRQIDLFGDAYEFLISNYAANAGKSGGEFFTPQQVSKLISMLAMHKQIKINKILDHACGSGALLLRAKKQFDAHIIEEGFFGQEVNHTTYNLARMNMFLHNINYDKFNIRLGNTLTDPQFGDEKPFDAIVSNPPYSVKWIGSDDPTLINDERFAPAGVLPPKSKADFAFVLHALHYLSSKGRAAIVCFPGIFYRGGAEQKIRKYLVDNNYVEAVISLAPNLFYGTTIAVNILVLSKHKTDTTTQFIDASGLFKKETNNNNLTDEHIETIMQAFDSKANVDHFARNVDFEFIAANEYNLSVSSYVETEDTRERVDIAELNAELKTTVARIDQLRLDIEAIVAEIEGEEVEA